MQQLLESEGVVVLENEIVGLESYFWDPNLALKSEG